MVEYEDERTPQEAAESRRSLHIGKAVSDAKNIKFDRVRKLDFRTSAIVLMERTLRRKSWQIVQEFGAGGWSHEDLMAVIWAGLLHENPDITIHDVWAIWDATPVEDRTKAVTELMVVVVRALGASVDEKGEYHSKDSEDSEQE